MSVKQFVNPNCLHISAFISNLSYLLHCCTLPDKRCLISGYVPLSGHDDIALFERRG